MKKQKKKIAFLGLGVLRIPSYVALLEELSKGYEIDIFIEYNEKNFSNNHFNIIRVFHPRKPRRSRELFFFLMVLFRFIFKKYDLIHCHSTIPTGFIGILIGKIFSRKVVVAMDAAEFSGIPDIGFGDALKRKTLKINQWVAEKADLVLALSNFQAADLLRNVKTLKKLEIIPRGINTSKYNFEPLRKNKELLLLSVSYMHPVKNTLFLVEVLKILKKQIPCRLIHVGRDYYNGEVQKFAKQNNLQDDIQFLGYVPHDQLNDIYKNADYFIHAARFESEGIVFLEAMASGIPVVTTKVGICADLGEEYCKMVDSKEPMEMATAILQLIENPILKLEMVKRARSWVEKNDVRKSCSEISKQYQVLFKEGK